VALRCVGWVSYLNNLELMQIIWDSASITHRASTNFVLHTDWCIALS
jgi:hypothetical protein